MPSDQDMQDDELQTEVIDPNESVDDTQDTPANSGDEGESETETKVELEKDQPESQVDKQLSPAEKSARIQEESWLQNVLEGKKAVKDAPTWLQPRLNKRLEEVSNPVNTESTVEKEVQKALAKQQEDSDFKALQSKIPPLTPAQNRELQERYQSLKPAGRVVALRNAMDAMGLSERIADAEKRGIAKGKMSLPRSGQPAVRKQDSKLVGGVPLDVVTDEAKWAELVRTGGQTE